MYASGTFYLISPCNKASGYNYPALWLIFSYFKTPEIDLANNQHISTIFFASLSRLSGNRL